jgi:hypothetical protein
MDRDEYTVPASEVAQRKRRSSKTIRRWLNLPPDDPRHLDGVKNDGFWFTSEHAIHERDLRLTKRPQRKS